MFGDTTAPPYGDRLRGLLFEIGLRLGVRLQAMQERHGAFGMGGGGEDRALVVLQHLHPGVDIGGLILARLGREAEVGGEERATEFSDKLLGGVAFVAPALAAEFPIQLGGMTSPVASLMSKGCIKASASQKVSKGGICT